VTGPETTQAISSERTYLTVRYVGLGAAAALTLTAGVFFPDIVHVNLALLGVFIAATMCVGVLVAIRVLGVSLERAVLWVAPFDLVAVGILGLAFHDFEDPAYAALLAIPVIYAIIIRSRQARWVGVFSALTYLLVHVTHIPGAHPMTVGLLVIKAALIVFLTVVVAASVSRHVQYELRMREATEEEQRLNEQLQRRLSELAAVSQITEIIHSSLDFDRVGPLVLEVLTKVVNVPSCALFVIDKRKSETLFSASVGLIDEEPDMGSISGMADGLEMADSHFACISVMDHHQMMVVFCAEAEIVDGLTEEDRLVLQAVSSELVVAVENSELYKLTKRLAITDDLTGLYNYRFLQQRLDEEIERAKRYDKDLSLLMLDVDDFKRFNDTHGHIAGDRALADLGRVLRANVREVDVVCRYGGEEFSIVLPETDAAGAFVVAEKVREAIAHHPFLDADEQPGVQVTVSVGLATFPAHAKDKESLLKMADDALYQAKSSGKDRVRSPVTRWSARGISTADAEEG